MDHRGAAGAPAIGGAPILLYDGSCGLCARSVQWVLMRDRGRTLKFAPLEGPTAAAIREAHPHLARVDSMVWVERDPSGASRVFTRSDAALKVARYVGGIWSGAQAAAILPRGLRDAAYAFIARHRHLLGARTDACVVPSPRDRERFLP